MPVKTGITEALGKRQKKIDPSVRKAPKFRGLSSEKKRQIFSDMDSGVSPLTWNSADLEWITVDVDPTVECIPISDDCSWDCLWKQHVLGKHTELWKQERRNDDQQIRKHQLSGYRVTLAINHLFCVNRKKIEWWLHHSVDCQPHSPAPNHSRILPTIARKCCASCVHCCLNCVNDVKKHAHGVSITIFSHISTCSLYPASFSLNLFHFRLFFFLNREKFDWYQAWWDATYQAEISRIGHCSEESGGWTAEKKRQYIRTSLAICSAEICYGKWHRRVPIERRLATQIPAIIQPENAQGNALYLLWSQRKLLSYNIENSTVL